MVLDSHEDAHHVQSIVQGATKEPLVHAGKERNRRCGNDLQRRMRFLVEPSHQHILSIDAQIGGALQDERSGAGGRQSELPARTPHHRRRERWQEHLDDSRRAGLRADQQDVRTRAFQHTPVVSRYPKLGRVYRHGVLVKFGARMECLANIRLSVWRGACQGNSDLASGLSGRVL